MASVIDICNLAINDLGGNPISDLDEDSKEARLCKDAYEPTLREILASHKWNLAAKWAVLAEDAGYSILDSRYTYAYTQPADFVRMWRGDDRDTRYSKTGKRILSSTETLTIKYVYFNNDPSTYPPLFVIALASLLKHKLSIPLAKRGSKKTNWYQLYLIDLGNAQLADAQESNEDPDYKKESDSWLGARS